MAQSLKYDKLTPDERNRHLWESIFGAELNDGRRRSGLRDKVDFLVIGSRFAYPALIVVCLKALGVNLDVVSLFVSIASAHGGVKP